MARIPRLAQVDLYRLRSVAPADLVAWIDAHSRAVQEALDIGTVGWGFGVASDGWPYRSTKYRLGSTSTRGKHVSTTTFDAVSQAVIRAIRQHQDDATDALEAALQLSDAPTPEQVDALTARAPSQTSEWGQWLVIVDGAGNVYNRTLGTEWRRSTGPITYEPCETDTSYFLRRITDQGRQVYRFGLSTFREHVSVGSGGYRTSEVWCLSRPRTLPRALESSTVHERRKVRSEKDQIIDAYTAEGWTYKEAPRFEYLTAPGDQIRLQIKSTAIQKQFRQHFARESWSGLSAGTVKKFVEGKNEADLRADAARDAARSISMQLPRISPLTTEKGVEVMRILTDRHRYLDQRDVGPFCYGWAGAAISFPQQPVPGAFASTDHTAGWHLGYLAYRHRDVLPALAAAQGIEHDGEVDSEDAQVIERALAWQGALRAEWHALTKPKTRGEQRRQLALSIALASVPVTDMRFWWPVELAATDEGQADPPVAASYSTALLIDKLRDRGVLPPAKSGEGA